MSEVTETVRELHQYEHKKWDNFYKSLRFIFVNVHENQDGAHI